MSAAFSRRGRVVVAITSAPSHGNRGVRPGVPARRLRAYPRRVPLGRGLYRATPRSPRVIGVRGGRVRFVAVAARRLLRRPRALRRQLRACGLESRRSESSALAAPLHRHRDARRGEPGGRGTGVAGRRPPRAHRLLARLLRRAERRQHRARGPQHARVQGGGGVRDGLGARARLPGDHRPHGRPLPAGPRLRRQRGDRPPGLRELAQGARADARRHPAAVRRGAPSAVLRQRRQVGGRDPGARASSCTPSRTAASSRPTTPRTRCSSTSTTSRSTRSRPGTCPGSTSRRSPRPRTTTSRSSTGTAGSTAASRSR